MYEAFASVYDRLMADVDYQGWAAYYAGQLGLLEGARIVECGCGTGNMLVRLSKMGYRLTGVDQSPEMLSIAVDKARRLGYEIPFVLQDMRRLALHRPQDAVIAPNDGVNYLLDQGAIRAFFGAAMAALKPGGVLGFDISSQHKLLTRLAGQFYGEEFDDLCYLWHNRLISKEIIELDLTFFQRDPDGRYRRFGETQRQRAWSVFALKSLLGEAGFENIRAFGERSQEPPRPEDGRIHIFAQKPGGTS